MVVQIMEGQTKPGFVAVAHRVVWCSVATVDRRGRPRSRILHPLWEEADDGLVGWIGTRPTPLKVAHLARTPFVSCLYRDVNHDIAVAECQATWVDDIQARARVWDLFRHAPAPVGYDPSTIWADAADPLFALLRLDPWRLSVHTGAAMSAGQAALTWAAPVDSTTH